MSKSISTVDANLRLAESFNTTIFADHDLSTLEDLLSEEFVHRESDEIVVEGIEEARDYFDSMLSSFPDVEMDVLDTVADEERVMQRFEMTATNDGAITMGDDRVLEPTGERLTWTGFVSMRIDDDRIASVDLLTDDLSIYQQLGVLPVGEFAA